MDVQTLTLLKQTTALSYEGDDARAQSFFKEYRSGQLYPARLVLLPECREEIQNIVRLCQTKNIALTLQGGNSGLMGGASPHREGVLMSLRRMNKILAFHKEDTCISVQAGVTLAQIDEATQKENMYFPLRIASHQWAQAGGVVATNAGGQHVFRYGMTRRLVRGLEVILPDGTWLNDLSVLVKDNSGIDVKQLFIGAEGVLGIISAVTFALTRHPMDEALAFIAVQKRDRIPDILARSDEWTGGMLTLFEYMNKNSLQLALKHHGTQCPVGTDHDAYLLLGLTAPPLAGASIDIMKNLLHQLRKEHLIAEGEVAQNLQSREQFFALRDGMNEAQKQMKATHLKHDISLPLSCLVSFLDDADAIVRHHHAHAQCLTFGHFADGSLHYNIALPSSFDETKSAHVLSRQIYEKVAFYGGSISAEHGIGTKKRALLKKHKDKATYELMCQLKKMLDPAGIINRDVLF